MNHKKKKALLQIHHGLMEHNVKEAKSKLTSVKAGSKKSENLLNILSAVSDMQNNEELKNSNQLIVNTLLEDKSIKADKALVVEMLDGLKLALDQRGLIYETSSAINRLEEAKKDLGIQKKLSVKKLTAKDLKVIKSIKKGLAKEFGKSIMDEFFAGFQGKSVKPKKTSAKSSKKTTVNKLLKELEQGIKLMNFLDQVVKSLEEIQEQKQQEDDIDFSVLNLDVLDWSEPNQTPNP